MKKGYLPKGKFCYHCGDLKPLEDYYDYAPGKQNVCIPCTPDAYRRFGFNCGGHYDKGFLIYLNEAIKEGDEIKVLSLLNGESPLPHLDKKWPEEVKYVNFNKYKKQYYDMHGINYIEYNGIILTDLKELNSTVLQKEINKLVDEEIKRRQEEKNKKQQKRRERRNKKYPRKGLRFNTGKMTYLMKDKTKPGIYKIGQSVNATHREKTLQSETPYAVNVKVWKEDIEEILHNHYDKYRVRGEWFKLTPMQVKYICTNDWTKYLN